MTIQPYRTIPVGDRRRTFDHEGNLIDAIHDGWREGWHGHERDVLCAEARRLGVVLWPALVRRLVREAASEFHPVAW
jgi:hypothetical protein